MNEVSAPSDASSLGEVITFYSYKGGTGRSMLLANVAWLLASSGRRVLVIDWDLEAPGLHRYFRPFLGNDPELRQQEGVIQWVTDYWDACLDESQADVETVVRDYADPRHYVRKLDTGSFIVGGGIDLLCAGRQDHHYAQAVADFDWTRLYQKLRGAEFIDAAKRILVGKGGYDYVFIDARTGVSDTSGFCTVGLADTLVVCFSYNNQSVIGASQIARDIKRQAELRRESEVRAGKARRFRLFAVPSRVDDLDPERLERRQRRSWSLFSDLLTDVAPNQQVEYWVGVQIRNHALFAYEEVLAACVSRSSDPQSVLGSVAELTRWLTDDAFTEVPSLSDEQRRELRMRFAEVNDSSTQVRDLSAWELFTQRIPDTRARDSILQGCFPLLVQLFTVADSVERGDLAPAFVRALIPEAELTDNERRMAEILTFNCVTQRRVTEGRRRGLLIRDESILENWDGLQAHLLKYAGFIQTRERLRRARQSWDAGGRSLASLRGLHSEFCDLAVENEPRAWLGRPNLELLQTSEELNRLQKEESELQKRLEIATAATSDVRQTLRSQGVRYNASIIVVVVLVTLAFPSSIFLALRDSRLEARARLADGWQLVQKHKFAEADAAFTPLVEKQKDNPAPLYGRSYARGQLKEYELAASDMERAIELSGDKGALIDSTNYYFLGLYLEKSGNHVTARKAFHTYLEQVNKYGASVFDRTYVKDAQDYLKQLDASGSSP